MGQSVVVAQDHAEFGLAVMVVDGGAEMLGEPADDLRVQRLPGAADRPQAPLHALGRLRAGRDEQPVGRRRPRQVGDAELRDGVVGALDGKGPVVVERGRQAHRERAGNRVVEPVGPARVGDVPEPVLVPQADGVAHVADEGRDGLEGNEERLGRARRARGEHDEERIVEGAGRRRDRPGRAFSRRQKSTAASSSPASTTARAPRGRRACRGGRRW